MPTKNKKGFTLIEVIIVVLMVSVLATIALNSYFNSARTFSFLSTYNSIITNLKNARTYAINDKQTQGMDVERYGVCLTSGSLVLFADNGNKPLLYERPDALPQSKCGLPPAGDVAPNDLIVSTYNFSPKYILSGYLSKADLNRTPPLKMVAPLLMYYEKGNGNFTMVQNGSQVVSKTANKYVIFKIDEAEGKSPARYIVVFLVSGLVEEYANLDSL